MMALVGIVKTFLTWLLVVVCIVHLTVGRALIRDSRLRRRFSARMTSRYCRMTMRILGITAEVKGGSLPDGSKPVLVVANHMGYLDIFILNALAPIVFITSVEVQRTFFLGFMSSLGGSLFVDRRSRARIKDEIEMIGKTMREGLPVGLFPEATSSNGETVLPFKAALLQVACELGADVVPLCIRYVRIDDKPATRKLRERVAYYGDMSFLPHFGGVPFLRSIHAAIDVLPPVSAAGRDRKELCTELYNVVRAAHERP